MPLPTFADLASVFDRYITSLHHQSSSKKMVSATINYAKSYLPSYKTNEYIQHGVDTTKQERVDSFKKQYKVIASMPHDLAVQALLEHLDVLYNELQQVKEADHWNESKYILALRQVAVIICKSLEKEPLYIKRVSELRKALEPIQTEIDNAELKGYTVSRQTTQKRNDLLIDLIKFGDLKATIDASKLNLLNQFEKPSEKEFNTGTAHNKYLDEPADIYPAIPWAFQPNIHLVFRYRLETHSYPETRSQWRDWVMKFHTVEEEKISSTSTIAKNLITVPDVLGIGTSANTSRPTSPAVTTPAANSTTQTSIYSQEESSENDTDDEKTANRSTTSSPLPMTNQSMTGQSAIDFDDQFGDLPDQATSNGVTEEVSSSKPGNSNVVTLFNTNTNPLSKKAQKRAAAAAKNRG